MQNARYNIKQRQKSFKVPNNAKARLYHVPQYANCIIMQYMKLYLRKLWNRVEPPPSYGRYPRLCNFLDALASLALKLSQTE